MAIYRCDTSPVSRGKGHSAVAAAARRAGVLLFDERTGNTYDYSEREGIISKTILLPDGKSVDRATLWNAAERAEKRKDARTARVWGIALPAELNHTQRVALAIEFGRTLGQEMGVAVDITVHAPGAQGDQRNHYAHVLTTTRQATLCQGQLVLGDKATLELSDRKRGELKLGRARDAIKSIRGHWAALANQHLAQAGYDARIDHRTLQEQGIDRVPTVHLGPVATAMERRGKASERGGINREIKQLEAELADLKAKQAINSGG